MVQLLDQSGGRLRPDIEYQVVVLHLGGGFHRGRRIGPEFLRRHHIAGDGYRCTARAHGLDHRARLVQQARFGQALADLEAARQHEGVGDAATDDQLIHIRGQAFQDGELGGHLGARDDRHQRASGRFQSACDGVDFCRQQGAGTSDRCILSDAVGAGLGPVRGAKCVMHEDVAQQRHLACQAFVVFLFAGVDTAVFQHNHLSGGDRAAVEQHAVDPVGQQRHRSPEQLRQALRHWRE